MASACHRATDANRWQRLLGIRPIMVIITNIMNLKFTDRSWIFGVVVELLTALEQVSGNARVILRRQLPLLSSTK